MWGRIVEWVRVHREAITSIGIVVLILAGLIIIWGGGEKAEESMGVATTETSLIPPISITVPNTWERQWSGAWRHIDEAATRPTTTTVRANRGSKTRTVLPNHATTQPGDPLARIRACESRGDYSAVSSSGKYRGAYQFDQRTWEGVGGTGDPATATPEEQDRLAAKLYAERGNAPWPNC